MRAEIYGAIVVKPIKFPDDLQILIYPLRRQDDARVDGCFVMKEHRGLDWVRNQYPVNSEKEECLKSGDAVQVFGGIVVTDLADGIELPSGSDIKILNEE
jgi:hypothetical protein